jgi:hypothetical protein
MTRYLVAADADQIQNLLFRSSHLREVSGGSMMLSKFCEDGTVQAMAEFAGNLEEDVIINDGGSFRMDFDSDKRARAFLEYLADLFREETGGTLTVAGPVEYEDGEFKVKNKRLQLDLLHAKYCRNGAEAEPQLPLSTFCTSCGIGLADRYARPVAEKSEEEKTYLCNYCYEKADENLGKAFFYEDYRKAIKARDSKQYAALEGYLSNPMDPAELIGGLDATQYVGYVLTDANGMGKHFNECGREEIKGLSIALTNALWAGLAAPIPKLIERLNERKIIGKLKSRMPIVPLILGGDDLLALVPARYALDIGRQIGQTFEDDTEMNKLGVTVGVAVVICQNHYPYTLAYERGHELLQQAKQHGKSLKKQKLSAISFEVILGNELKGSIADKGKKRSFRSTLKPYWIGSKAELNSQEAKNTGIHFDVLLEQRLKLKDIPQKRLHELRRLFDQQYLDETLNKDQTKLPGWLKELEEKRLRIGSDNAEKLKEVLAAVGDDSKNIWRSVSRTTPYSAHGMLDLIEAWDYAYKLDEKDEKYRPEES